MTARHFTLWSIVSKLFWTTATLALAVLLPTHAFAQYAFLQISSAFFSQLALGVLGNVVTARLAQQESTQGRSELALAASLYGASVCAAAYPVLVGLGALGVPNLDPIGALAVSLLAFATYAAGNTNSYLATASRYGLATIVSYSQTALYLLFLFATPTKDGVVVAYIVALSQMLPSILVTSARGRIGASIRQFFSAIWRWHRRSTLVNLSYFPNSLLLWYLTAGIAGSSASGMAGYGLANQVANLFLFVPTSMAPIVISSLSGRRPDVPRVLTISGGLLLLATVGSAMAAVAGASLSQHLPPTISHAVPVVSVALLMAGFVAARSPFAWQNQINHHTATEVTVSLTGAAVTACILLWPDFDGIELMTARTAAALVCLIISAAVFWRRERSQANVSR